MNLIKIKNTAFTLTVILILATACGREVKRPPDLSWPPPPAKPRITFVKSLYGTQNLKRSFPAKIKDFLFGKSPTMNITKPYGVLYDGESKLYVADTAKKGILVFDLKAGGAKFYNSLGKHGKLGEPVNIIFDSDNNIYVADTKLGKVAVFSDDFAFSHFIGDNGELISPVGMAFDKTTNNLYVVDTQLHKVKIFSRNGTKLGEFGGRGDQQGEFHYPLGIAISPNDTIYVVDSFHFAVQAFDLNGNYLFSFGPQPTGTSEMARPRSIAFDSRLNLYVTDALNNNVQVYNDSGELLYRFGGLGYDPGKFRLPAGIFIEKDLIYVSDSINNRIQIFRYMAEN